MPVQYDLVVKYHRTRFQAALRGPFTLHMHDPPWQPRPTAVHASVRGMTQIPQISQPLFLELLPCLWLLARGSLIPAGFIAGESLRTPPRAPRNLWCLQGFRPWPRQLPDASVRMMTF